MIEDLQTRTARARVGLILRGKWILEELLGVGGMAAVYRARHRNGASAALKILHPLFGESEEIRTRFAREGYVANKIHHPAVVRVHDDDVDDDGLPFFVMDLIEGQTLADKVRAAYFGDDELLEVAEQICDALAVAHDAGVVHRDLKPDNLLVDESGKIHVLDFGIARLLEDGTERSQFSTRTGIAFGTPGFSAPEQALGKRRDIGPHSDLFALGSTLFYLATGEFVHAAETPQELLVLVATQPARSLSELAPHLSPEVTAIVDRATRLSISERWSSASAMLTAVRRVRRMRAGESPHPLPTSPLSRNTDGSMTLGAQPRTERTTTRVSTLPARPSIVRRRRKRSLAGVATAFTLVTATSFLVTGTHAHEPVRSVAAAAVVTDAPPATDQAPPSCPAELDPIDVVAEPKQPHAPKSKTPTQLAKMLHELSHEARKADSSY
ncbi:MAG: serine/threonine-protein kinase [Polyangiales bacterium]